MRAYLYSCADDAQPASPDALLSQLDSPVPKFVEREVSKFSPVPPCLPRVGWSNDLFLTTDGNFGPTACRFSHEHPGN
jgi:hypothetical protein